MTPIIMRMAHSVKPINRMAAIMSVRPTPDEEQGMRSERIVVSSAAVVAFHAALASFRGLLALKCWNDTPNSKSIAALS
jgi:hypothetical protein